MSQLNNNVGEEVKEVKIGSRLFDKFEFKKINSWLFKVSSGSPLCYLVQIKQSKLQNIKVLLICSDEEFQANQKMCSEN